MGVLSSHTIRCRGKVSGNGRRLGVHCVSKCRTSRSSAINRVCRGLGYGLRGRGDSSVEANFAGCNPRHSSVRVVVGNGGTETFTSRKRRQDTILSLGLTRTSMLHREVNRRPIVLLSSILSRLSTGERSFLLGRLRKYRIFVAYYRGSGGRRLGSKGVFLLGGKRID